MDAWIDLVLARAAELRAAGITSIGCDGCTASIGPLPDAPYVPEKSDGKPIAADEYPDAMHDPATYPGGVVPGFVIEKLELED